LVFILQVSQWCTVQQTSNLNLDCIVLDLVRSCAAYRPDVPLFSLQKLHTTESTEVNNIAKICISVESFPKLSLPTITLIDSVEPRCAYQCSAVLASYETSVRLWTPTRVYPGPFSVRGSVSQEIVECIKIFKYREKFPNVPPNVAGILSGSWQFCSSLVCVCFFFFFFFFFFFVFFFFFFFFFFAVTVVGSLGYGKLF